MGFEFFFFTVHHKFKLNVPIEIMGLSGQHFPGKTHSIEKIEFDDHFSAGIGHVNGGFWPNSPNYTRLGTSWSCYFTGELLYIFVYQG